MADPVLALIFLDFSMNVKEIRKAIMNPKKEKKQEMQTISTGSTLLDLAISGGVVPGGGMPLGILVEIFGPSSSGKTAILSEIAAIVQLQKGEVLFLDPEGRLNQKYAEMYGFHIDKKLYAMPDTVNETFTYIREWKPKGKINVVCTDSLAALSTELEMQAEDKMGMKRAKDFSTQLRKVCRHITKSNLLVLCTNQIRQGEYGEVTPGGKGIPFYASLRLRVLPTRKIKKVKKLSSGKEVEKIIGIESKIQVVKSSLDDPFRIAPIYLIFNYGIDDIRANLQWYKDTTGDTRYDVIEKKYQRLDSAIKFIEENELEDKLKERVIELWYEIENKFKVKRKGKRRIEK